MKLIMCLNFLYGRINPLESQWVSNFVAGREYTSHPTRRYAH